MKQGKQKVKNGKKSVILTVIAMLLVSVVLFFALGGRTYVDKLLDVFTDDKVSSSVSTVESDTPESGPVDVQVNEYSAVALPEEMRAMWISYLEWESRDISTEEKMRSVSGEMFDKCKELGLNTVLVHVRAFGDALYKSEHYPWSHLISGTQGIDPGYDPLAVMVEEAHTRGLRIEAYINPLRVIRSPERPPALADNNPAKLFPEWTGQVGEQSCYNAGLPQVRSLVADGVQEIVERYNVDGIHFDDYFYPEGVDESFDKESFAQYGNGMQLGDWRRQNVSQMLAQVYQIIKAINPSVSFGVSPQGNNDNNYNKVYLDTKYIMEKSGYIDYVMPQLYWGFNYEQANGNKQYAFKNILAEWAAYPRAEGIKLYAGLGVYRIGGSDGGANDQSEWSSGQNIAAMVEHLRAQEGATGFALFRHDFMFNASEPLAQKEAEALQKVLQ